MQNVINPYKIAFGELLVLCVEYNELRKFI